ncbi:MAG: hypothetical protein JXB62_16250 [Pirellulales bacterium]|nr:hypothetical protein [Pirellulales bacterium]
MRHLIATITDTISTVVRVRPIGMVVVDVVTRGLRASDFARSLLMWLAGHALVCWQMALMRHLRPAEAGAGCVLRRGCLSTLRTRRSWYRVKPGSGANAIDF